MNDDLRSSLDILNTITSQRRIVLHEEDFVDGSTELTDNQIKQLFMILAQGAVYKKIQGSLNGYTPSFKLDKVDDEVNEDSAFSAADFPSPMSEEDLNEASIFSKMKDAFVDKFGTKGQKMAIVAKNTSKDVWNKWESESITGGIPSTVEAVGRWIKNKGVESDLIDLAFTSIGVPNINNTIGIEEPEVASSEVKQWLDDEMLMATAFTGALAKDFLLDKGVPEDRADKMLGRMGITSGKIVSKEQYGKLDTVAQRFGGASTDVIDTPTDEETPTTDWSASKVRDYILNKYEIDSETLDTAFIELGIDLSSDAPIGDNILRKLTNAIVDQVPEKEMAPEIGTTPETVMDKTQEIMRGLGGSVNKSVQAGKKAIKNDDFTSMSELQKLGIAILTTRKKI